MSNELNNKVADSTKEAELKESLTSRPKNTNNKLRRIGQQMEISIKLH